MEEMTPSGFLDQTIKLWERLAMEMTYIIGEGGFQSLFSRSIFLAQAKFPWLEKFQCPFQYESEFSNYKACFAGRNIVEIRDANALILTTFIETLSALIGDTLTTYILRSVWEQHRPVSAAQANRHQPQNLASFVK